MDFLQRVRQMIPAQTPEQDFECIQTLKEWAFWLPPALLREGESDLDALTILAQFFGVSVALGGAFRDVGGAYLMTLCIGPLEDIHQIILSQNSANQFTRDTELALTLTGWTRHVLARCKPHQVQWAAPSPMEPYLPAFSSPYRAVTEYAPVPPTPSTSSSSSSSASSSSKSSSASSSCSPSTSSAFVQYTPSTHPPSTGVASDPPFVVAAGYEAAHLSQLPPCYVQAPYMFLAGQSRDEFTTPEASHCGTLSTLPAFSPTYDGEPVMSDSISRPDTISDLNIGLYTEPCTSHFQSGSCSSTTQELCQT